MNTISFPNIFNKNDSSLSTTLSYDIESINESLNSLFYVNKGELLGDPDYGTELRARLFDLAHPSNIIEIKTEIANIINTKVTRIETNVSMIKIFTNGNNNKYRIVIGYVILNSNKIGTFDTIVTK